VKKYPKGLRKRILAAILVGFVVLFLPVILIYNSPLAPYLSIFLAMILAILMPIDSN